MSIPLGTGQMPERTAKFVQQIGEVIQRTVDLGIAMARLNNEASRLDNEATQEPPKEAEVKPAPKSRKRKASRKPAAVTPNQAGPSHVARPPARKPYNGTAPLCNQCSLHHQASVKCRKCQTCGLIGHTARVCPTAAVANQAGPIRVATPPAKKAYAGTAPHCARCNGHHAVQQACWQCTTCGKLGHLANVCRLGQNQASQVQAPVQGNAARFPLGSCFNCGEIGHFRHNCPRLVNANANANPTLG